MRNYIVLTIAVACVTSVVTSLVVSETRPAGAATGKVQVVSDIEVQQHVSSWANVEPGDAESRVVVCPNHSLAVGGGFHLQGYQGVANPSVTASYELEGTGGTDVWHVTVADPKLAHPVEMQAAVLCLTPTLTEVSP